MSQSQDDQSKEFEPTPRKLEKAREKGDVPKSADLNVAATYGGVLLVLIAAGGWSATNAGAALSGFLAHSDKMVHLFFSGRADPIFLEMVRAIVLPLVPVFLIPAVFVLLSVTAQRAFVFAPSKIAPKASRISPLSNGKNKFGANGLFEFAKSAAKLIIFSIVLGMFLIANGEQIIGALTLGPKQISGALGDLTARFLMIVLAIAAVIGLVDFVWQRSEFTRRNRMSRQEIQDEQKDSEGDPHTKQARRQRGQEIATQKMLADVPGADVIVVNPTHYAVALKWDRFAGGAPIVVAKGVDFMAARIRETAMEAAVPIYRDPPTARAIFAKVEIGQEILPENYRAVAVAIRFAEDMARRAKWRA